LNTKTFTKLSKNLRQGRWLSPIVPYRVHLKMQEQIMTIDKYGKKVTIQLEVVHII